MTSFAISASVRRRWPALAGIAFAVLVTLGVGDLHHYRASRVVARALAEFCLLLGATLAVLILIVTVTGPA
jgi:hypothetical protein